MQLSPLLIAPILLCLTFISCQETTPQRDAADKSATVIYPSSVITGLDQWRILLANGESQKDLIDFAHEDYFFVPGDEAQWIAYKAPNYLSRGGSL